MFWNTLFYDFERFHIIYNKERKVWYILVLRRHWLFKKWVRKFYLSDSHDNPMLFLFRKKAYNFIISNWKQKDNCFITNFDNLHKLHDRIGKNY